MPREGFFLFLPSMSRFPWIWMAWKKRQSIIKAVLVGWHLNWREALLLHFTQKSLRFFPSFCSVCVPVSLFSQKGFDFLGGCCCQSTQTRRSSENETCFTSKLMGVSLRAIDWHEVSEWIKLKRISVDTAQMPGSEKLSLLKLYWEIQHQI